MALVALLVILVTVGTLLLLRSLNATYGPAAEDIGRRLNDVEVLEAARGALLAYAVAYPEANLSTEGPGRLPCPDGDNDGDADGACALGGPVNDTVGRLPYRELGRFEPLVDAAGEPLWYAVADSHRNSPPPGVLNSDSGDDTDALNVDGLNGVLAVILAPGPPLPGQDRASDQNAVAAYLEGDNASAGDGSFSAVGTGNDQLVVITRGDLNSAVERRVAQTVRDALAVYLDTNAALPYLAPFSSSGVYVESGLCLGKLPVTDHADLVPGTWFETEWVDHVFVAYGDVDTYAAGCSAPLTVDVQAAGVAAVTVPGVEVVILVAGRELGGQNRALFVADQFFEGDNHDGDAFYDDHPKRADHNDVTLIWEVP